MSVHVARILTLILKKLALTIALFGRRKAAVPSPSLGRETVHSLGWKLSRLPPLYLRIFGFATKGHQAKPSRAERGMQVGLVLAMTIHEP